MPVGKTGDDLKDFERIDWDSLTFANNYVFLEVMNNKKRCQYLIEKILHIPITKILQIVAERRTGSPRISSKSIRLDVYVETLDGTVIDHGKGLPTYHFTNRCREDESLEMGDLTEQIFLNAKAADKTEDKELSAFLRYVNSGQIQNEFTQEIDDETKRVKRDTDWRERVVTWEMDLRVLKKEAREEGKNEKALEIAEALRKKGMSEAEIAKVTGLPEKKETLK